MAEKWIQKAVKKLGALRKSMGVKAGKAGAASQTRADIKKVREVIPVGAWMLAAALVAAVLLLGV